MKKIIKWILIGFAAIILLVAALSLYIYLTVDKEWVEDKLEASLSRKVSIEEIRFSLFTAAAGLYVDNIAVSERMGENQINQLSFVPEDKIFLQLETGRLHFKLLPLISRRFDIREIALINPEIYIIRNSNGTFNFSDLFPSESGEKVEGKKTRADLNIGSVIINEGHGRFIDRISGNSYEIIDFNLSGEEKNAGLNISSDFNLKALQLPGLSFARDLNVDFEIDGQFEKLIFQESSELPSFQFMIHTPQGRLDGFRIFEKIKQIPVLVNYFGNMDFLGENLKWKEGKLKISQEKGTIEFSDGEIRFEDYRCTYNGSFQRSGNIQITAVLSFPKQMSDQLKNIIQNNLNEILNEKLRKQISISDVARELVKPLTTEEGNIQLTFDISGTPADPMVSLSDPDIPDFGQALTNLIGSEARSSLKGIIESLSDRISEELLKKKK
jgi:hypothetical protein